MFVNDFFLLVVVLLSLAIKFNDVEKLKNIAVGQV